MNFNPDEIAENIVMRCVGRKPCHFSVAVEAVRLSDVSRLVGGYSTFGALVDAGKLLIDDKGILSLPA